VAASFLTDGRWARDVQRHLCIATIIIAEFRPAVFFFFSRVFKLAVFFFPPRCTVAAIRFTAPLTVVDRLHGEFISSGGMTGVCCWAVPASRFHPATTSLFLVGAIS